MIWTIWVQGKYIIRHINSSLLSNLCVSFQDLEACKTTRYQSETESEPREQSKSTYIFFQVEYYRPWYLKTINKRRKKIQIVLEIKPMKSKLVTSSATSTDSVKLTAFKTSNKTAAVWYAFVSRALFGRRGKQQSKQRIRIKGRGSCSVDDLPVSFISSILQCLNIFPVVMLIKTLHFPSITFGPSCQCSIIFLEIHESQIVLLRNLSWNHNMPQAVLLLEKKGLAKICQLYPSIRVWKTSKEMFI